MSDTGRLAELGPAKLLRYAAQDDRTGRLVVTSARASGVFGYDDGRLVFASCGGFTGEEAVHSFLTWDDGVYEFLPGEKPGSENVFKDLNVILTEAATKLEPSEQLDAEQQQTTGQVSITAAEVRDALVDFVARSDAVVYVALVDERASVVVEASASGGSHDDLKGDVVALVSLAVSYPPGPPRRLIVDGSGGSAFLETIPGGFVIALAGEGAAPGSTSYSVSKLVSEIAARMEAE
jgi:hypothetical protein